MSTLRTSTALFVLLAFQPEICAFAGPSDCARLSSASRWLRRAALAHSNGPRAADSPPAVPFPSEEELQRLTRYMLARLADSHRSSGKGGASAITNGVSRRLRSRKRLTAVQVRLLLRDLLLVASGLRTSCLVDCCSLPSELAGLLLESLAFSIDGERKEVRGIANVRAVLLDGNVFFINVEAFVREKMVGLAGECRDVQFVDVSANLATPQSFQCAAGNAVGATRSCSRLERLSRWTLRACESLLEALATSTTRVLQWQKPSSLNATALAGIMLCYPVVYDVLADDAMEAESGEGTGNAESGWDEQENCLALCPLVVVQTAVVRVSDQIVMTLHEFSVPQHLLVCGQTGSRSKPQDERIAAKLPLARTLRASCITKLQRAVTRGNLIDAGIQPQVILSVRTLPRVAL